MLNPFFSMKKFKSVAFGLVTLSALGMFAACGDDSSSPAAAPSNPGLSSSSTVVPPVGDDPNLPPASDLDDNGNPTGPFDQEVNPVPESSSGVDTPVIPPVAGAYPDEPIYTIDPSIAVTSDEDGFYSIADIYKAVPTTSKIAFVIRHSARDTSTGQLSPLIQSGAAKARALGEAMAGGDESFYYASTNFVRTRETAANIAVGRGETPIVDTLDILDGNYFYRDDATLSIEDLKKKSTDLNTLISRYCYNVTFPNAQTHELVYASFYPLFARGNQFVKEVILDNMPKWKRVSILVSHDVLAEPMIVYASNRAINLKTYSKDDGFRWVNFMSGVAIVVNEAGAVSIYPVRGYDVGWQQPKDAKAEAMLESPAEQIIK